MRVLKRSVLQNTLPGHHKFYELNLCEEHQGTNPYRHRVVARWGRIEKFESGNTQQQVKCQGRTDGGAQMEFNKLRREKLAKGYVVFREFNYTNQFKELDERAALEAKRIGLQPVIPKPKPELGDRTEVLETPVEQAWWKGVSDLDRDL